MATIKVGDTVYALTLVEDIIDSPEGHVLYGDWSMHDPALVLPFHPALKPTADLLADHGAALVAATRDITAAFDSPKFGFDDEHLAIWHETEPNSRHGLLLRADTLMTLRKLAAALTEGTDDDNP